MNRVSFIHKLREHFHIQWLCWTAHTLTFTDTLCVMWGTFDLSHRTAPERRSSVHCKHTAQADSAEHADTNHTMQQQQQKQKSAPLSATSGVFDYKNRERKQRKYKSSVPEVTVSSGGCCRNVLITIPTQTQWYTKQTHPFSGLMVVKGSVQPNYSTAYFAT